MKLGRKNKPDQKSKMNKQINSWSLGSVWKYTVAAFSYEFGLRKKHFIAWAWVSIWMLVIFAFSSISTTPSTQIFWRDFIIKKTAHVIEFFTLTLLVYRAARLDGPASRQTYLAIIIIALTYAISDELHQKSTPGRQPSARDVGIDSVGILLAIYLVSNLNWLSSRFPRLRVVPKFLNHEQ